MRFLRRHPILISIVLFFFATQFISLRYEGRQVGDSFSSFILTLTYYPQKLIFILTGAIVNVWQNYIELVGVRNENERLRNEIRKLRQEKFHLWEAETEFLRGCPLQPTKE